MIIYISNRGSFASCYNLVCSSSFHVVLIIHSVEFVVFVVITYNNVSHTVRGLRRGRRLEKLKSAKKKFF